MTQLQHSNFSPGRPDNRTLILVFHGIRGSPAKMGSVRAAVLEAHPGAAVYAPRLAYANPLSLKPLALIASDVLLAVEEILDRHPIDRIIVVGHSMGSLVARKIVILAHGEVGDSAPFEQGLERWREPRPWANAIERVVLLAGMSRGWSTTAAHDALTSIWWSLISLFGDIFLNGRWTILGARVGAPFVVQTRLQWLALFHRPSSPDIVVAQLLGSLDDTVSPDDTVDFVVDLANESFVLIDLPNTAHKTAIQMAASPGAELRRERFIGALTRRPGDMTDRDGKVATEFATNGDPPKPREDVTDVVFVIHGIRDKGFWTQKIARKVMEEAHQAGRVARAMTLSYGYLAMGPFLLPWVRRSKVRWLMDRYADSKALYPNAKFYYVGHSNGTYLAARALRDYPSARFERLVFAGSVVRQDYEWQAVLGGGRPQAREVLNYVASADWVVAIFPNGLSPIRAFDLGGAGHRGFDAFSERGSRSDSPTITRVPIGAGISHQVDFISGGHAAGIRESQWDDIARFIVRGSPPECLDQDYVARQKWWAKAFGALPPVAFLVILCLAVALGALLIFGGRAAGGDIGGVVAACLFMWLVYLVITKL